ncbi:MAG: alpha/beta hydrolase [Rhodobiaceae bacterium]|nr:alpha/beta hydrolase [Rhodobiaceae bacterium]
MKRHAIGASVDAKTVTVEGVELAYERWGNGVPVICLHAIGHGAQDFRPLADRVGDEVEIIAVDWPRQGRSGDDEAPASATHYCDLLEGFAEALGLDRFVLFGNSIGGAAAILYADRHPSRVRGLILSNPGGLAPVTGFSRFAIGRMVAFFRAGLAKRWWFSSMFKIYYGRVLARRAARTQRNRIIEARFEIARPLVEAWESFVAPDADIRVLCARLQMPVLYAWAVKDKIVPLGASLAAVQSTPNYKLAKFRAGHMPALETPKQFAKAFQAFLKKLPE